MVTDEALRTLFFVVGIAALAPILIELLPGPNIPQVVLFLVGGVLIGPDVLGFGDPSTVQMFSEVGLGFLFLMAGYEVDPKLVRKPEMKRAVSAWLLTAALSLFVTGILVYVDIVSDYIAIAIGLTTTALGTILPIVRDNGMLRGPLGTPILTNGAVGEFFPIIAITVFLGTTGRFVALITLAIFAGLAVLVLWLPRNFVPTRVARIVAGGTEATSQSTLRWVVVLLIGLLLIASQLGLDVILGAFAAGIVLRLSQPSDIDRLENKLDAVGYGFFIPIYFIVSGMDLDLDAIIESPERCLLFFGLLLGVRGLSVFLLHRYLPLRERTQLALLGATALPLLVALSQIGMDTGDMRSSNAAALVGAGVLSVLVFPLVATKLNRKTGQPKKAETSA